MTTHCTKPHHTSTQRVEDGSRREDQHYQKVSQPGQGPLQDIGLHHLQLILYAELYVVHTAVYPCVPVCARLCAYLCACLLFIFYRRQKWGSGELEEKCLVIVVQHIQGNADDTYGTTLTLKGRHCSDSASCPAPWQPRCWWR